jgi:hypothetical protein
MHKQTEQRADWGKFFAAVLCVLTVINFFGPFTSSVIIEHELKICTPHLDCNQISRDG